MALHAAVQAFSIATVNVLLHRGVDVSSVNGYRNSVLHDQYQPPSEDRWAMLEFLLNCGAPVDNENDEGETPLFCAALDSDTWFASRLLQRGANVNARSYNSTPLHQAVARNKAHMVEFLLDQGAKNDARDDDEMTPLHYLAKTAEISTKEIMKMLIDAGSEAMAIDRHRNTILHFAMGAKFAHGAYFRVNHCDINVNVRNHSGDTPLQCCVTAEHVRLLLRRGADVNAQNGEGRIALHLFAQKYSHEIVRLLVQNGCDVNILDGKD